MADRPILFSAPMVRAILREIEKPGTGKTQTRRILKPQPYQLDGRPGFWNASGVVGGRICVSDRALLDMHGKPRPGDRLWVRETVIGEELQDGLDGVRYVADNTFIKIGDTTDAADKWVDLRAYGWPGGCPELCGKKVPSIHMPKWASRLTLIVTDVRVERLQDCSREDAIAEGIEVTLQSSHLKRIPYYKNYNSAASFPTTGSAIESYRTLWNSINGPGAWDANPWVAVYTFRPVLGNIDQIGGAP